MAVGIDNVYQQVLAIANKEQRGYITPQEFNLFSRKAQLDIFESYFNDVKKNHFIPGINNEYGDNLDMLEEQLSPFKKYAVAMSAVSSAVGTLPTSSSVHKLGHVIYEGGDGDASVVVERVNSEDMLNMQLNVKVKPMKSRPAYVRISETTISLSPAAPDPVYSTTNLKCNFIAKPSDPKWAYVVVNDKALYNANLAVNFELHASEEGSLVNKILELAGISMKKPALAEVALRNESMNEAKKNN